MRRPERICGCRSGRTQAYPAAISRSTAPFVSPIWRASSFGASSCAELVTIDGSHVHLPAPIVTCRYWTAPIALKGCRRTRKTV